MTEPRYEMLIGIKQFRDKLTGKTYCEYNLEEIVELLNNQYNTMVELRLDVEELKPFKEKPSTVDPVIPLLQKEIDRLTTENEQLKKRIKKSVT